MESISTLYTSPSLNSYSSNTFSNIADGVIQQLRAENAFGNDDVISFNYNLNHSPDEFEFPIISGDFNSRQISTESVSGDQIRPQFPLFNTSLLSDGADSSKTDSSPPPAAPATARRSSLIKLLTEDRDTDSTTSSSSSEADELEGVTPGTYCVWNPKAVPRGKHKKSNSICSGNTSNRWKVRDLLKRSYSDVDGSTVKDSSLIVFIPPVSAEKMNKVEKSGKIGSGKTEKKIPIPIPVYGSKMGNVRLQPYMPYREDQLAAFANFAGGKKNMYRY